MGGKRTPQAQNRRFLPITQKAVGGLWIAAMNKGRESFSRANSSPRFLDCGEWGRIWSGISENAGQRLLQFCYSMNTFPPFRQRMPREVQPTSRGLSFPHKLPQTRRLTALSPAVLSVLWRNQNPPAKIRESQTSYKCDGAGGRQELKSRNIRHLTEIASWHLGIWAFPNYIIAYRVNNGRCEAD